MHQEVPAFKNNMCYKEHLETCYYIHVDRGKNAPYVKRHINSHKGRMDGKRDGVGKDG